MTMESFGMAEQATDNSAIFDFNRAAARARQDFPAETKNVTFLDLSAIGAREQLKTWLESTDALFLTWHRGRKTLDQLLDEGMREPGFASFDPISGKRLVAARSMPNVAGFWPGATGSEVGGFTFAHELGHAIVPGGADENPMAAPAAPTGAEHWKQVQGTNRNENAAESFGVLYSLQNGWMKGTDDIAKLSLWRAESTATKGEIGHFTSPAVDALTVSLQDADFVSLTPQEIIAVAAKHAESFTPSPKVIEAAVMNLAQMLAPNIREERDPNFAGCITEIAVEKTLAERFRAIAEAYMSGPAGTLEHYAVSRFVPVMLAQGGSDLAGEYWDNVRATVAARGAPGSPSFVAENSTGANLPTQAPKRRDGPDI